MDRTEDEGDRVEAIQCYRVNNNRVIRPMDGVELAQNDPLRDFEFGLTYSRRAIVSSFANLKDAF